MDHYAVFDIQHEVDGQIFPELGVHNLAPEFADLISNLEGLRASSLFRKLTTTSLPFRWLVGMDAVTGTRIGRTRADEAWDDLFDDTDIAGGYCVPAQVPGKRRSVIVYFKKLERPKGRYSELVLETLELFEQLLAVNVKKAEQQGHQSLNASERNCLVWCACGKTSGEIGTILSLSEHTVNHYFTLAGQKLGTNNRVHTVARAIKLGLIDPSELN